MPQVLGSLSSFFARCPGTRLDLHFEAVTGPWERLFDDEVDLILHRIDKSDPRLEWIDLGTVSLLPVVAPGFLPFATTRALVPEQLQGFTQCIIRDTARHMAKRDHFVVEGAPQCTVADHEMKKQIILHAMAWGHVPRFLIEKELQRGRLQSIAGATFPVWPRSWWRLADATAHTGPSLNASGATSKRRRPRCAPSSVARGPARVAGNRRYPFAQGPGGDPLEQREQPGSARGRYLLHPRHVPA